MKKENIQTLGEFMSKHHGEIGTKKRDKFESEMKIFEKEEAIKMHNSIPFDYSERLNAVMAEAWKIFKAQFINNRHFISTEAPFQHHFADIIKQVGNLYCLTREDVFLVDLETQCKDIKGKTKYLDISCEFVNRINCAIELKFKKASQGAQDHGRIDIYTDIEALELVCRNKFHVGKFYTITDSKPYINQSKIGVGTVFSTHHGHTTQANKSFWINSKGREHITVELKNSYTFNWEKINEWYFLELTVPQSDIVMMEENEFNEIWNGYCPESLLKGKKARMRLNTSDFYESENTGLQICIVPGVQAIVLNFRGKGKFKETSIFADDISNGELLSPQNTETFPFNNPPVVFQETEEFKIYLNTIK